MGIFDLSIRVSTFDVYLCFAMWKTSGGRARTGILVWGVLVVRVDLTRWSRQTCGRTVHKRTFKPDVRTIGARLMISSGKTLKTEIAPITLLRHTLARHVGHWSKIDFFKQQRSRDFYKNRWLCGWIFIQIHVVVFFKLQITPVNFYTMKIKK